MSAYLYIQFRNKSPISFRILGDSNPTCYKDISMEGPFHVETDGGSFHENYMCIRNLLLDGKLDDCKADNGECVGEFRKKIPLT